MGPCTGPCILRVLSPLPLLFRSSFFLRVPGNLGKLRGSVGMWEAHPSSNFPFYPSSPLTCIALTSTCTVAT